MRRLVWILSCALVLWMVLPVRADEGMWTFNNFPRQLVQQRYAFSITDAWLDHVRLSSVRFNNGGSGSFVSPEGLVMTNHHVGSECIQEVSTATNDYMANGFYAPARDKEAKCSSLELNVLMGIEDVTSAVNAGLSPHTDAAARLSSQRATMSRLEKECTEKTGLRCDVVILYEGGVFNLYRYKKYTDVRLVFAPEAEVAFYGGDPDNFTYPRYDLDVAFFHVYENNQPVKAADYLVWNTADLKEKDLVFVSGNPGSTDRQKAMAQLQFLRDVQIPVVIQFIQARLKLLRDFTARGPEQARVARDTILSYENSLKVYVYQLAALRDPEFFAKRAAVENSLRDAVAADPKLQQEFGNAWSAISAAEKTYSDFYSEYSGFRVGLPQSRLYALAAQLVRLSAELAKPNAERLREYRDSNLDSLKQDLFSEAPIYPDLEALQLAQAFTEISAALGSDSPLLQQILAGRTPSQAAADCVKGTKLSSVAERKRLFEGGKSAVDSSTDPMIQLARLADPHYRQLRTRFENEIQAVERANGTLLAKALFAVKGTSVYPEATFTLRLSFGAVRGYMDEGRPRRWYTTLAGAYELNAGIAPYNLPWRWLDNKKNVNLDTPYNFVSTPDITGGNSGSPILNQKGELVGIVFDGNIQSIANDFLYSDEQVRTVSVHAAGIVEALRKIYGADAVVRELKLAAAK